MRIWAALKYWIWLAEQRLSNQVGWLFLEHFASPEDIYYSDSAEYLSIPGMTCTMVESLENKDLPVRIKYWGMPADWDSHCDKTGCGLPVRLKNIYDPPCLLYVRPASLIDEEAAVAVVGT